MTRAEINEKIRLIVFQQLKASGSEIISSLDDIKAESEFMTDLGADSLDVVEIVTSVEEEFDLLIPDDLLEEINTVGQAVDYISTEVSSMGPAQSNPSPSHGISVSDSLEKVDNGTGRHTT